MKKVILLISLVIFLFSCDENNTNDKGIGDAQYYYFSTHLDGVNKIYRVNLNDGKKEVLIDSAETYCLPVNGKMAYMRQEFLPAPDSGVIEEQYLYLADADGSGRQKILDKDFGSLSIKMVVSPTGDRIAYRKDGFLYIINLNDGSIIEAAQASIPSSGYVFSNDGRKIGYATNDNGVFVYDIESGLNKNVLKINSHLDWIGNGLTWSYDNNELIFPASINDTNKLVAVDIKTNSIRDIIEDNYVQFPAVYNSGKRILYLDMTTLTLSNYIFDIYTCNIDGTDIQKITPDEGNGYQYNYYQPFINDNEIIAFRALPYGNGKCDALAVINVKTKKIRIVSENFFLE